MAEREELAQRLLSVQTRLKAPKGNINTFGNYAYRSCEDILEAVKPLLDEFKLTLTLSDEIVVVGKRYYVKAEARVSLPEDHQEWIDAYGWAREAEDKKGMDVAQITGAASSYARKYALNGLFNIDDTKDADTNEQRAQVNNSPEVAPPTGAQMIKIKSLLSTLEVFDEPRTKILDQVTSAEKASELIKQLLEKVEAKKTQEPYVEPVN